MDAAAASADSTSFLKSWEKWFIDLYSFFQSLLWLYWLCFLSLEWLDTDFVLILIRIFSFIPLAPLFASLIYAVHSTAHQIYYVLKMVPMQWFQRVSYIHVTQQTLGLPGTHPVQVTSSRKNWVTCLWVSMTTYT